MKYLPIDWLTFKQDCQSLAQLIGKHKNFLQNETEFYAIQRGGLTPAAVLANLLGVQEVRTLNLRDMEAGWNVVKVNPHDFIIDDIYDTGNTYNMIRKFHLNAPLATVYGKRHPNVSIPNDVIIGCPELPSDKWLVFPWE